MSLIGDDPGDVFEALRGFRDGSGFGVLRRQRRSEYKFANTCLAFTGPSYGAGSFLHSDATDIWLLTEPKYSV